MAERGRCIAPDAQNGAVRSEVKSSAVCMWRQHQILRPTVSRIMPRVFLGIQVSRGIHDEWRVTKEAV